MLRCKNLFILLLILSSKLFVKSQNIDSLVKAFRSEYSKKKVGISADTTMLNYASRICKLYLNNNQLFEALKYNQIENLYYLKLKSSYDDAAYLSRIKYACATSRIYILEKKENYNEALELSFALLNEYENSNDALKKSAIMDEIAYIYYVFGKYDRALEFYNKGHDEVKKTQDTLSIGISYTNLYGIHAAMGDTKSAIAYCLSAAACFKKINHRHGLRVAYGNLAIYYSKINLDQALSYSMMAKELSGGQIDVDNPGLEDITMGEIYTKKAALVSGEKKAQFLNLAEERFKKVEQLGQKLNNKGLLSSAVFGYSEIEKEKGNFKAAYEQINLYHLYKDTVLRGTNFSGANSILKYEFDKKEQQQALLFQKKEAEKMLGIQRQKTYRNVFIFCFVLVSIAAIFIFKGYRTNIKAYRIISAQKLDAEIQNRVIEEKQIQLLDSLYYAERIQRALIKDDNDLQQIVSSGFVIFKPKDIISGDFYWFHKTPDGTVVIALADCTGHGVPGALLSMIGISAMNEIVHHKGITDPWEITRSLSQIIGDAFKKAGTESKTDGMDFSVCSINTKGKLLFLGVNQPLYIADERTEVTRIEAHINSVNGIFDISESDRVEPTQIDVDSQKSFFLITDGIIDQFGGNLNKKYLSTRFEECILKNKNSDLGKTKAAILNSFESWRGRNKQTDDITVLGFRV